MSWYTTGEILLWLILAALLGFILGWLIRGLLCSRARADIDANAGASASLRTPDASLRAPSVDVKAPAVHVPPAPSVALKAPAVDVKAPAVDLKAPAVDLKAPAVDLKAPAVDVKAPAVDVKAPAVGVTAPAVGVNASAAPVRPASVAEARAQVGQIATRTAGEGPLPKDNLEDVYGIGPVIAKMLHGMGITSFRQIARFNKQDIATVESALEFFPDRIVRDDWMASARQLNIKKYGVDPLKA